MPSSYLAEGPHLLCIRTESHFHPKASGLSSLLPWSAVPSLLHPPGARACPGRGSSSHKLVGVGAALYAAQEMYGRRPGQTWPRICVQQWGWKADLKNDDADVDDHSCLPRCFWCSAPASLKRLHVTLPWEGQGSEVRTLRCQGGEETSDSNWQEWDLKSYRTRGPCAPIGLGL